MNKHSLTLVMSLAIGCILLASTATDALAGSHGWFGHKNWLKGSGDLVTEERTTDEFSAIKVSGSFDIFVTIGEKQSIKVTFDDNLIEYVETEVRHGRLEISIDKSYSTRSRNRIDIVVPNLEEIYYSGSGDSEVSGLKGESFVYEVSGSGHLTVDGEVDELRISVSGSGDVDARNLKARKARVRISGSGNVKLFASESVYGRISGSGDIVFYGNPEHVSRRVSGSGSIRRKG